MAFSSMGRASTLAGHLANAENLRAVRNQVVAHAERQSLLITCPALDAVPDVLRDEHGDSMFAPTPTYLEPLAFLGVNDDHLPDNRGEFVVTVGVSGRTSR